MVSPIAPEDSSGFLFNWLGIPGVVGVSPTEAATIKDRREAFLATVSALIDLGRDVPAPPLTARDFEQLSASGKFVARSAIHAYSIGR